MVVNNVINLVLNRGALQLGEAVGVRSKVHRVEVEVFLLVKVWQFPVDADVFQS